MPIKREGRAQPAPDSTLSTIVDDGDSDYDQHVRELAFHKRGQNPKMERRPRKNWREGVKAFSLPALDDNGVLTTFIWNSESYVEKWCQYMGDNVTSRYVTLPLPTRKSAMSESLYVSCAQVLSVCQGGKDDLALRK